MVPFSEIFVNRLVISRKQRKMASESKLKVLHIFSKNESIINGRVSIYDWLTEAFIAFRKLMMGGPTTLAITFDENQA